MSPEREPGFNSPLARFAPTILGIAMVVAIGFALYAGRGTTFTPDEWFWLISTPGMTFETLFLTSSGHLQLVPRAVYKVLLTLDGTNYFWFRLLSVASLIAMVALLYRWLLTRVGAMVALVPCLLMLFFGSDAVHLIRGNGFTIIFSIVCGLAALLLLEREDRLGDILACGMLALGLATYTVALPFLVGAGVSLLLARSWRRLWIPALPLVLYGLWKLWLRTSGPQSWGGDLHLSNVFQIPEWIFNALSSVLSAMTGIGYGFTDIADSGPDDVLGPILATLFLLAVAWRFSKGSIGRPIWVALSIGVSLWAIQCLAADPAFPEFRTADETRYLYPGAVAVIMIGAELVAGKSWKLPAYLALVAIGAFGTASNIQQALTFGDNYREDAKQAKLLISAQSVTFDDLFGQRAVPGPNPVLTPTFGELAEAMGRRPFGGIGYSLKEMRALSPTDRATLDLRLVGAAGLELAAVPARNSGTCLPLPTVDAKRLGAEVGFGNLIFKGPPGAEILVGRFGDQPTVPLTLPDTGAGQLELKQPFDDQPWRFAAAEPGSKVCQAANAK